MTELDQCRQSVDIFSQAVFCSTSNQKCTDSIIFPYKRHYLFLIHPTVI